MAALATHTWMSASGGNSSRATSSWMSQPSRRSSVITSRPSALRRSAIAAPMPRAAPVTSARRASVTMSPRSSEGGTMTERWFRRRSSRDARPTMDRAIEAIDGRARSGQAPVLGNEARVADAARLDGRRAAGPRVFHPAAPRNEGVAEARTREHVARLAQASRWDRGARSARIVGAARRHLARPLRFGRGAQPWLVHDHRGRGEDHLRDAPVRLRAAAGAERRLQGAGHGGRRARRTTGPSTARTSRSTAPTAAS